MKGATMSPNSQSPNSAMIQFKTVIITFMFQPALGLVILCPPGWQIMRNHAPRGSGFSPLSEHLVIIPRCSSFSEKHG
jgi:hypothetical protein